MVSNIYLETSEEPKKPWNVAWCSGGEQKERGYGEPWNVCTTCGEDQGRVDRARGYGNIIIQL